MSASAHPKAFGYLLSASFILIASWCDFAVAATSASQFGITWRWSEDRQVGQFVNGDWWVVGPITLTSVTRPNGKADMDGSQFGPEYAGQWGSQGFDSRVENVGYDSSLNVANKLPLSIPAGRSLISSISEPTLRGRCQLNYQAVLTILGSAPAAGSFRPPYLGTDKSVAYNKSRIDYSKLLALAEVGPAPDIEEMEEMFLYPIIMVGNAYPGINYLTAWYNCPLDGKNYGREVSFATSRAALMLNTNRTNAQKELLAIRFIQYGLDIYGGLRAGLSFPGEAGHNGGRKIPMLLAGILLNDTQIVAAADGSENNFSEDVQHFYVSQQDVNLARYVSTTQPADPYPQSSIGMPEWGPAGGYPNNTAGYNWGRTYRAVVGPNLTGTALVVKLMGLESKWNDQAFVDYYFQRFVKTEHDNDVIDSYVLAMWDAYSNSTPQPPPPPAVNFEIGDRIVTTANTNVRAAGALTATLLGTQSQGAMGTILAGPVQSNNITWWQINYDSGVDGWSGEDNLELSSAPTPPSPPSGLRILE